MNTLNSFLPILQTMGGIAVVIAGYFMARKAGIIQIKNETILSMQQQIDALKAGQETLQKDNGHLQYVIETISAALKQKGIVISIEGEMITINDGRSQSSSIRRSTKQPQVPKKVEKDVS